MRGKGLVRFFSFITIFEALSLYILVSLGIFFKFLKIKKKNFFEN